MSDELCGHHEAFIKGHKSGFMDAIRLKHHWINVEDRLPTESGRYIVYIPNCILLSKFYACAPEPHFYECNATHWMPLPNPPYSPNDASHENKTPESVSPTEEMLL